MRCAPNQKKAFNKGVEGLLGEGAVQVCADQQPQSVVQSLYSMHENKAVYRRSISGSSTSGSSSRCMVLAVAAADAWHEQHQQLCAWYLAGGEAWIVMSTSCGLGLTWLISWFVLLHGLLKHPRVVNACALVHKLQCPVAAMCM